MNNIGEGREASALPRHRLRLACGTPVFTLHGALPVEFLVPGDRIITRAGARSLLAVDVTVQASVDLVRFGHSTLAHGRPEDELLLPADQPVLVRGGRARLIYGVDQVQVAAASLADGRLVRCERGDQIRICALHFAEPVVIYAGEIEAATLPSPESVAA